MSRAIIGKCFTVLVAAFCLAAANPAVSMAEFDSGSTGEHGALGPVFTDQQTPIEITINGTDVWITLPEDGVIQCTTLNVPVGNTLKFKKNAQNTPVTILASSDVTIAGNIGLNGTAGNSTNPGGGGPGGFDGGWGGRLSYMNKNGTCGEGPGGGNGGNYYSYDVAGKEGIGAGGSFHFAGQNGYDGYAGVQYGSADLINLIGGSGGGGTGYWRGQFGVGGGGGGGAILIASSGTIDVTGGIYANGGAGTFRSSDHWYVSGKGYTTHPGSGGGSGGAIRLVADVIKGNGAINALGAQGGRAYQYYDQYTNRYGGNGGNGWIRLEANTMLRTVGTSPEGSVSLPAATVLPTKMPSLRITAIGGVPVSAAHGGDLRAADIQLPYGTQNPVTVEVACSNIPLDTQVNVVIHEQDASKARDGVACSPLQGSEESSTTSAEVNFPKNYISLVWLTTSYTLVASADGEWPMYAAGERVTEVRLESSLGGEGTLVTLVTETGKEIVTRGM